jgi:hypothetical protein
VSSSALAFPPDVIGRLQVLLSARQVSAWAKKIHMQTQADPQGRARRFWAVCLGLSGPNLDLVLRELGEPAAPPWPPILDLRRAARAHFRLLEVS